MKFELKEFQVKGVRELYDTIRKAVKIYYNTGECSPVACSLRAPTGSGKTIMSGAVIEGFLQGNDEMEMLMDESISFLWVSDSPSLNRQTMKKFLEATEINPIQLEEIRPEFTQYHSKLDSGRVYFLNRQLLASGNILVRGGETLTFWQVLKNTINDSTIHLVMILDEAHKGIGSTKTASGEDTIYGKLINGEDGHTPMPVVVGISATPKRFQIAMSRLQNRTNQPPIEIKPADVQASGLLKDKIIISVPTESAAVDSLYTKAACNALKESTLLWAGWCSENSIEKVIPLLVIQVPNKVETGTLASLCLQLCEYIDYLNPKTSFAHVFGDEGFIHAGIYEIPKVEPEEVQRKTDIRVLFAKEAISTGWDCPRAEVIYSMRTHKDSTYVGQLIGRMVRTPLARQVSIDKLNSVTCYLPQYDPKAVQEVVKYLTDENADDYGAVAADASSIIVEPVDIEWDTTLDDATIYAPAPKIPSESKESYPLPGNTLTSKEKMGENESVIVAPVEKKKESEAESNNPKPLKESENDWFIQDTFDSNPEPEKDKKNDDIDGQISFGDVEVETYMPQNVRQAFTSICSRVRAHSNNTKWILGAITYAGLLAQHDIDKTEVNNMRRLLTDELVSSINIHKDKFDAARNDLVHVRTTRIELQYLNAKSVKTNHSTEEADKYAIENGRKSADRVFTLEITNEYVRRRLPNQPDVAEINTDLAAASYVDEIVKAIEKLAKIRTEVLMKKYEGEIYKLNETGRADFELQMNKFGIPHTVFLRAPQKDTQNKQFKEYARHVVNNPENHMAYFDLSDYEDYVIRNELKRDTVKAWYRNPQHGLPEHTLSIIYRYEDSRRAFHPDFIVFDEVKGGIKPSIIDPHGVWIGESLAKLRGLCDHAEEFGRVFNRIWAIDRIDGNYMYLDVKDENVRDFIKSPDTKSAPECYKMFGKKYE